MSHNSPMSTIQDFWKSYEAAKEVFPDSPPIPLTRAMVLDLYDLLNESRAVPHVDVIRYSQKQRKLTDYLRSLLSK